LTTRIGMIALLLTLSVCCLAQQAGLIRKIEVQGNKAISTQAILLAMRTKPGQPYVQANLDSDKAAIDDLGWFDAVDVRAQAVENNDWDVIVIVSEFPVVKEIRIVGNTVFKTDDLLKLVTVKKGSVFNLKEQVQSARKIEAYYTDKGYNARVEDIGPLAGSPNTVNIKIGETTIDKVEIQGNSKTKTSVFGKLIKSKAGEAFNKNKWALDIRRIYSTQWFENVHTIVKDVPNDPSKIDLIADVKETRTGQFNIGLQMDPRSSIAGVIKLQDTNFRGTGQGVSVDFLEATTGGGASVGFDYNNPFVDRNGTALHASIYSRLIYRFSNSIFGGGSVNPTGSGTYTERRTGLDVSVARPFNDIAGWSIGTRFERVFTNDASASNFDGFIKQDGDVGTFTLGFTRNRRDVDLDPSRGDFFRLLVEPGFANITSIGGGSLNPDVLGQHPFIKYSADFRKYWSPQPARGTNQLDAPRKVLAFRAYYGVISGRTPFFEQFFAGGPDSLRGYDQDRFWGNQTLVTNLELRIPVQKAFSLVGFVDYGGAWGGYGTVNNFTQSEKFDMHLGYGMGFMFRTPLGPLRLDLGFDNKGRMRTDFLIGTSF